MILRGAELVAPVDEDDLVGELRQEGRLLHRGVAAADHDHALAAEERGVADGAVADAAALQRALARRPSWRAFAPVATMTAWAWYSCVADVHACGVRGEVDAGDVVGDELGAEPLGLRAEHLAISSGPMIPSRKPG